MNRIQKWDTVKYEFLNFLYSYMKGLKNKYSHNFYISHFNVSFIPVDLNRMLLKIIFSIKNFQITSYDQFRLSFD